jgi:hypothetical protein
VVSTWSRSSCRRRSPLPLVVVLGPEPALDHAAEALHRAGGDDALGRAADAEQQVDAGALGRAAMIAPATSPSVMNLIRAPVADLLDQLLVARPVEEHDGDVLGEELPLALATWRMFSATGSRMSTTSAASGPVTSFSM